MILKQLFIGTLLLLLPQVVIADGKYLLDQCNVAVTFQDSGEIPPGYLSAVSYCYGYLEGIGELNSINKGLGRFAYFCVPKDGIPNTQAARIVVKYLRDNPAKLHENKAVLAVLALKEAYPCK